MEVSLSLIQEKFVLTTSHLMEVLWYLLVAVQYSVTFDPSLVFTSGVMYRIRGRTGSNKTDNKLNGILCV